MKDVRRKNVYLLGSSSLLNDAGSEMITPLLPFFLTSLGGGGVAVGVLSGLREGLSSLFKLLGGWFSDRVGKRKEIVFAGYLISVLMKIFMSISQTSIQLTSFVALERLGKSRDAPRDAIVSASVSKAGEGFGIHQAFDSLGGVIGTLTVLLFLYLFGFHFREIVLIAAAISMLSLIPLFFVKDVKINKSSKNIYQSIKYLSPELKKIIFIFSLFSLANFGLASFLLLKLNSITESLVVSLSIYTVFSLVTAIFSRGIGKLSDQLGRKRIIAIGYSLFIFTCLGLAYLNSFVGVSILFLIYGIVFAMVEPTQKAYISDYSKELKGTSLGFYHFSRGIAMIMGGLIAGLIWDISSSSMFIYLAIIGFIALTVMKKHLY